MKFYQPNSRQPEWMNVLPVDPSRLSLKELRNFKDFHRLINTDDMKEAPPSVRYFYQCFRFLYFFVLILIDEKRFPALNKCWDDLRARYSHMEIFEDGVFLESWIFFDFPITEDGRTVLDEYEASMKDSETLAKSQPFIQATRTSRLGLYQEVLSTSKVTKFKELFTNRVISTLRSVLEYNANEIFLGRIVQLEENQFLLGDPKCFPPNRKQALLDMVTDRILDLGYADPEFDRSLPIGDLYGKFMKIAGPYWMSVVCDDHDSEILQPHHHKKYYRS